MESTQTTTAAPKKVKKPLNGVDVPTLFATINAVAGQPELAAFKFRCTNEWIKGTHSRATIESFDGAGGTHEQTQLFQPEGDHPPVLCGKGNGPTPVEYLLSALAQCLTAGIGNIASARGITLESVKCTVEGDVDMRGLLGIDEEIRNGYSGIRVRFEVAGDASPEDLKKVVAQSQARSAVLDVLTNGCSVDVSVA